MSFARHQTFYLRSGWLAKALEELRRDPRLFSEKQATIRLGIGKNMVESLRFWIRAAGLVEQLPRNEGMGLTRFGQMVVTYDPFLELDLTWWLIHYHIVKDETQATSWYFLFNRFPQGEFDRSMFIEAISKYSGQAVTRSSYQKDFDCIVATYIPPAREQGTPEDNTICPLTRLGLLESLRQGGVRKTPSKDQIPLEVIFLVMREAADSPHCNVSSLMEQPCNVAKVFNLSLDSVYRYLDLLQDKGWLRFSRTAGVDTVVLDTHDPWQLISEAYKNFRRGAVANEA